MPIPSPRRRGFDRRRPPDMCESCGCNRDLEQLSGAERVKARRNALRGTIAHELLEGTPIFSDDAGVLMKFHGVYQQDDRDRRKEARRLGLDKHHMMMIRTRIPGGIVDADAYLAHDRIAGEWGNGTLRVTTRQDLQLHGVLKGDLKRAIRAINKGLLTTLGGCGDVERNIMCCPAPSHDTLHNEIQARLTALVDGLTPTTRAYSEIWLDGELAASNQPEQPDPLYGDQYLPRKFKTAVAIEGATASTSTRTTSGWLHIPAMTAPSMDSMCSSVVGSDELPTSRTRGRRSHNRSGTCPRTTLSRLRVR
jgi:sulfite reductase beta subunit-like hemoprotein